MYSSKQPGAYQQIRHLLAVIFSGVIAALVFGAAMLYYYGPTGRYLASNVMLAPGGFKTLDYKESDPSTGQVKHFTFAKLEFTTWLTDKKQWRHDDVSEEQYRRFYQVVLNDVSAFDGLDQLTDLFNEGRIASLKLLVQASNDQGAFSAATFQTIQFSSEGNLFRIDQRSKELDDPWIYFRHPGITKEANVLFSPRNGE